MSANNEAPPSGHRQVGAVVAAVRVLTYLADRDAPVGVNQIARDTKLNPSTCFNILRTLAQEGLVSFDAGSKAYEIGFGLAALAKKALDQNSYIKLVRPQLTALARTYNVTATLWYRTSEDRVMLIDSAESGAAIRLRMSIGQRLPLLIAALGRCMAARLDMPREELERRFKALRWANPVSFEDYLEQVRAARDNGYAIDQGNFANGITTASSVVVNGRGVPVMAISAVALSAEIKPEVLNALGTDLNAAAARISAML